jgi:hypothetical protein
MQYLPLFLLLLAALIAGWFYLQRAKARDVTTAATATPTPAPVDETAAPASAERAD